MPNETKQQKQKTVLNNKLIQEKGNQDSQYDDDDK
mgnify:CR=1 FL=1